MGVYSEQVEAGADLCTISLKDSPRIPARGGAPEVVSFRTRGCFMDSVVRLTGEQVVHHFWHDETSPCPQAGVFRVVFIRGKPSVVPRMESVIRWTPVGADRRYWVLDLVGGAGRLTEVCRRGEQVNRERERALSPLPLNHLAPLTAKWSHGGNAETNSIPSCAGRPEGNAKPLRKSQP